MSKDSAPKFLSKTIWGRPPPALEETSGFSSEAMDSIELELSSSPPWIIIIGFVVSDLGETTAGICCCTPRRR